MEAKYRVRQTRGDGVASMAAAVSATVLLVVVISLVVAYFIGSTLPYATS